MTVVGQEAQRTLAEMQQRIAQFAELEPDWDSYGAKPITQDALDAAKGFLRAIVQVTVPTNGEKALPAYVAPIPNGGILIEWHGPMANLEVEVTSNGTFDLLVERRVDDEYAYDERADVSVEEVAPLLDEVLSI